jgi:uncharacterized protein YkwD
LLGKIGAMLVATPLFGLGALAAAAVPAGAESSYCHGANLSPTASNAPRVASATLCLINQVRRAYQLRPLQTNRELRKLASSQAHDMVRWNYFADDRPPGLTPLALVSATHYPARATQFSVGQNIGWGTGEYATPAGMVAAWIASPGHLEVILTGEYREVGVGVAPAVPARFEPGLPGATYAIEFAVRRF